MHRHKWVVAYVESEQAYYQFCSECDVIKPAEQKYIDKLNGKTKENKIVALIIIVNFIIWAIVLIATNNYINL